MSSGNLVPKEQFVGAGLTGNREGPFVLLLAVLHQSFFLVLVSICLVLLSLTADISRLESGILYRWVTAVIVSSAKKSALS